MEVTAELADDMVTIMSDTGQSKISYFIKFFWEEQQKYLKSSSTGIRCHTTINIYYLSFTAKSFAAYDKVWFDEKK